MRIKQWKSSQNAECNAARDYLKDLGLLIKDLALEAKTQSVEKSTDFSIGYMAGFHRVVSLMQQQAETFGISMEDIGLENIDPDKELV
ncbi:hypothetical protein [Aestuariispira ectoiniformans]|uniref:hypothetical protein n=1 Tax=Aestuariispira ectoiniformans TaxID=2775080 RepID=UPI00223B55EE|nr:hypothetical protein [Aestuariispira ectoiniformans]